MNRKEVANLIYNTKSLLVDFFGLFLFSLT